MFDSFIKRENEIFDILEKFQNKNLTFILVGGYAVSVYRRRFSIDADIVVQKEELNKFEKILNENKFEKGISKGLSYSREFKRFVKKSTLPVNVDVFINGLSVRQTSAVWDFKYILSYSSIKTLKGIETKIKIRIPEKELLIAMKIHSARATDLRDVVALFEDVDVKKIKKHLNIPNKNYSKSLQQILKMLDDTRLRDAFKGVFQTKKFNEETIQQLKKFIEGLL